MLAALVFGIAAGAGVPYVQPHVKRLLGSLAGSETPLKDILSVPPLKEAEISLATLALCLAAAALLAGFFGHDGSAFAMSIGAVVGVFGPRILARIQKRSPPDYDR